MYLAVPYGVYLFVRDSGYIEQWGREKYLDQPNPIKTDPTTYLNYERKQRERIKEEMRKHYEGNDE